jgi:hypothetical protein
MFPMLFFTVPYRAFDTKLRKHGTSRFRFAVESICVENCPCVGWSPFSKKLLRRLRLSFALSQCGPRRDSTALR